jgi:hypothetical protein
MEPEKFPTAGNAGSPGEETPGAWFTRDEVPVLTQTIKGGRIGMRHTG